MATTLDETQCENEVIPRHIPDNPYNYTLLQLAERKRALKDLVRDYPDLSLGWLEMAYDFHANTPQEEIKRIIGEKLWEGPGKFSDVAQYYGSTHTLLSKRMSCHLSDTINMCVCVQILLRNNYTTSIVKEIEYENNSELLWEERWAIEADSKAININVPVITDKERQDLRNKATDKWRTTEHGIEYTKAYSYKYYHENKEECLAKNKTYKQTETGKAKKAKCDKKYHESKRSQFEASLANPFNVANESPEFWVGFSFTFVELPTFVT